MITIRSVKRFLLTIDDRQLEVEQIGKGRYSTAYKSGETVYLKTSTDDSSKEMLCSLSGNHKYLPLIQFIGSFNGEYNLYEMPLYQPLLAASKTAWAEFKVLKQLWEEACKDAVRSAFSYRPTPNECARVISDNFNSRVTDSELPEPLKDAVDALVTKCQDYGGYQVEISKRNCAVDKDGSLILLDPCFDREELEEDLERRRKKALAHRW